VPQFEGKVVLVTGAGRGLGRATARIFASRGAAVSIVDIDSGRGEETAQLIKNDGGQALYVRSDVSRPDDVEAAVGSTVNAFGGIDCAVNNAVLAVPRCPLADTEIETWNRAIAVNFTGVFICMKFEIQAMLKRGAGAIVNIASLGEFGTYPGVSPYLASKHGVLGMTKVAAMDYALRGIRINAVGPGSMRTELMREAAARYPQHLEELSSMAAMGRIAEPEEVGRAIVWLCSDEASYITGQTLVVDGGTQLRRPWRDT
jgi:NAD(P)-dependent dehydrogenase (short-subunit alcohol dehydrogenase family)